MPIKKYLSYVTTGLLLAILLVVMWSLWKTETQYQQQLIQDKTASILTLLTKQLEERTEDKVTFLEKLKELWKTGAFRTEAEFYAYIKTSFQLSRGLKSMDLLSLDAKSLWHIGAPTDTEVSQPNQEQYLMDYTTATEHVATGEPRGPQKEVPLYLALPAQGLLHNQPIILKAILDTGILVQKAFNQEILKDYLLSFSDNQFIFYQHPPFSTDAFKEITSTSSQITVGSRHWTVRIAPLSTETSGSLPTAIIWAALVLCFAAGTIYLFYSRKTILTKKRLFEQRVFSSVALLPQLFCELDTKFRIRYANPLFLGAFGLTEDSILSGHDFTLLFPVDERFKVRKLLAQLAHSNETHCGIFEMQGSNAIALPYEITFAPFKDKTGKCLGFHSLLSDISEKRKLEKHIKQLTYYDELTDLPNRTLFKERIGQEIARYSRSLQPTALVLVDIDRFKLVNDALGHLGGDALLKIITERLASHLRQGDTLARLGSDEFAIILSNSAHDEQNKLDTAHGAQIVARKILTHLTKPFLFDGREIFMSGNIGIALYPQDAQDTDSLIRAADVALSSSKTKGKNNFQFYLREHNVSAQERLDAEKRLRYALKKQEFELRYLPKFNLKTGKICGTEALLSWKSPEKGLLLPDSFLHYAEENGLIVPIGKWVLKTACLQLQEWRKMGFSTLQMAVNFSIRQIQEENFLKDVQDILQESGITPRALEFEIQEKILLSEKVEAKEALQAIKNLGVTIVLDDFGKGYSALSYLRQSPVSQIKIDAEFIQSLPQNTSNKALVEGLIAFAHHLGLSVTAEGVETKDQYDFLKAAGCDEAQGYYLSRPLTMQEVEKLLSSH